MSAAYQTLDLIRDSRLETSFRPERVVIHIKYLSSRERVRPHRVEEAWVRQRLLGNGSFGRVWLEKCISGDSDGRMRAVKEIAKISATSQPIDYGTELAAIAKFSHSKYNHCFVKSDGWYESDQAVFIAMDYHEHGDLQKYMRKPFPENETREMMSQILEGLEFLHYNSFAHRDLKPGNILVISPGPDWWVKINDFGISKRAEFETTGFHTAIGTEGYIAPEIMGIHPRNVNDSQRSGKNAYTDAVDIWAAGELTFRLLTTKPVFPLVMELVNFVREQTPFPHHELIARDLSLEYQDITAQLMSPSPKDRPAAREARQHAWFLQSNSPHGDDSAARYNEDSTEFTRLGWETVQSESEGQWNTAEWSTRPISISEPTGESRNNGNQIGETEFQEAGRWTTQTIMPLNADESAGLTRLDRHCDRPNTPSLEPTNKFDARQMSSWDTQNEHPNLHTQYRYFYNQTPERLSPLSYTRMIDNLCRKSQ